MYNCLTDALFETKWRKIPVQTKTAFFSSFIMGLLIHTFMLTNKLPNHDDLGQLVDTMARPGSGRWFLQYPAAISSNLSMPWVNGVLCIIYISIASCLVVSCLKIHQKIYCALIASLMISIPTVASTLAFMQSADGYFFCLMLACLAAFIAERYKYGFVVAVVPLTLSMGGYQAYFGVTAGLLILMLTIEILKDQTPWKKTLFKGFRFVGTLGVSMAMYFSIVRIAMPSNGLTTYMGIDKMGKISLTELPTLIIRAYSSLFEYFLRDSHGIFSTITTALFTISFLLCGILVVVWCVKQNIHKEPMKLLLLAVLLLVFPLGCNIIYVMFPDTPHMLMIYGTVLVPIFLLTIVDLYTMYPISSHQEKQSKRGEKYIVRLSCLVITVTVMLCVYNYYIISNQAYLKQFFAYEITYAQSVSLISSIQGTEGYTVDAEIVLVGKFQNSNGIPELNKIKLTGFNDNLIYAGNYPAFLKHYLDFTQPIVRVGGDSIEDSEIKAIISEMPLYPNDGSVMLINDKIYVNFSY